MLLGWNTMGKEKSSRMKVNKYKTIRVILPTLNSILLLIAYQKFMVDGTKSTFRHKIWQIEFGLHFKVAATVNYQGWVKPKKSQFLHKSTAAANGMCVMSATIGH